MRPRLTDEASRHRARRLGIPLETEPDVLHPLRWADGEPWSFRIHVTEQDEKALRLEGILSRGEDSLTLAEVETLPSCGILLHGRTLARMHPCGGASWIGRLRRKGPCLLPRRDLESFLAQVMQMPSMPALELPASVDWRIEPVEPEPQLEIHAPDPSEPKQCRAHLVLRYGDRVVQPDDGACGLLDHERRAGLLRNRAAEIALAQRLSAVRAYPSTRWGADPGERVIRTEDVPQVVRTLVGEGWTVRAEKIPIRTSGQFKAWISSGVDWFDLQVRLAFGQAFAELPAILSAIEKGQSWVLLDDGTHGMIPDDWLARFGALLDLGQQRDGGIRFQPSQAALLDALIEAEREVECDAVFARLRERLRKFTGIQPQEAPPGFRGTLREYQKLGLGWLHFLREFGFGGCLADDMGLGKTIQVLALLASTRDAGRRRAVERRAERRGDGGHGNGRRNGEHAEGSTEHPSLVVAPRSLIHNWMEEAARFTPRLRVLDHSGSGRTCSEDAFRNHDLVLTTYGTLRRDIVQLHEIEFEFAILDEAQAIKNSTSLAAKASRLLRARHRLALTGTPVENRLAELWSIFEFLNPGMLGSARVFQEFSGSGAAGSASGPTSSPEQPAGPAAVANRASAARRAAAPEPDAAPASRGRLELLARALRPFLLRRTKEAVLAELPPRPSRP